MKKNFLVKISDLLRMTGQEDTIEITHKKIEAIPNLVGNSISGSLYLQSINETTILAKFIDVTADLEECSDISGTLFIRHVVCPLSTVKFSLKPKEEDDEDEIFPIDPKNETIDLEEALVQCILLGRPIVMMTPEEEANYEGVDESLRDTEPEKIASEGMGGTVVLHK